MGVQSISRALACGLARASRGTGVLTKITAVACALALSLPATTATAATDPALLSKAAEAFRICDQHMPNSKAAKDALKAAGYRYEGIHDGYHFYSLNGRRIMAGTSVTNSRDQMCIVVVSKMTPAEAEQIIAPLAKERKARKADLKDAEISALWMAPRDGHDMAYVVFKKFQTFIIYGAAIGAFIIE